MTRACTRRLRADRSANLSQRPGRTQGTKPRQRHTARATRYRVDFGALAACVLACVACNYDRGDRWLSEPRQATPAARTSCEPGDRRCLGTVLQECREAGSDESWTEVRDCAAAGKTCAQSLTACAVCDPGGTRCDGPVVERCAKDGSGYESEMTCEAEDGQVCRAGRCRMLCAEARSTRSNVGCEYWAVDLDNANVSASLNAAAQQFAVVVSNPQPDVPAFVTVERDDTEVGVTGAPVEVGTVRIAPLGLEVLRLGPREVDGSPPGEFNTGSHTALTRSAYRVSASVPVVAYQFNPLENVNVFSNDASLLKPVEALPGGSPEFERAYVAVGWPQTIASTDDPDTNFNAANPVDYRSFLTIVGTESETRVRVRTRARILGGGPIPDTPAGDSVEFELDAFDVANLETDDFGADFTGSIIETTGRIVVFSGSEAADAPSFDQLGDRRCCADHLEEQLDPIRTAGKRFVASVSPNRSRAIARAGGQLGAVEAPEYFRIVAATDGGAHVTTSLPDDSANLDLDQLGDFADVTSSADFLIHSDAPIIVASVSASQAAAGVPVGQAGGDPSFLIIPPIEQYRRQYVFLTPDRYRFDFVRIASPADTQILLDGDDVYEREGCSVRRPNPLPDGDASRFEVVECQLSFPVVSADAGAEPVLLPGDQDDGVHEIVATRNIGVIVDGFDRNVSYAYAAGTELMEIVAR